MKRDKTSHDRIVWSAFGDMLLWARFCWTVGYLNLALVGRRLKFRCFYSLFWVLTDQAKSLDGFRQLVKDTEFR